MPRLGALIATERAATVNEEWGIIKPPMREICFNAAIVNNDGLLATSIARREQISYESACVCMEKGIAEMKNLLDQGDEISLGRIGTLSRSSDGRLRFVPSVKAEQQAASIGLGVMNLSDVITQKSASEGAAADSSYYHLRISKSATRIAASILLPVVAAISILLWTMSVTESGTTDGRMDYASVIPMSAPSKKVALAATDADVVSSTQGKIVVAVFNNETQADLFISQHAGSVYELEKQAYGETWRVTVCGNSNREALVRLLHSTDFIVEYPGAWIWIID